VLSQFTGNVPENDVAVGQLHPKHCSRQDGDDRSFKFDRVWVLGRVGRDLRLQAASKRNRATYARSSGNDCASTCAAEMTNVSGLRIPVTAVTSAEFHARLATASILASVPVTAFAIMREGRLI
jgi:hypothetical protein